MAFSFLRNLGPTPGSKIVDVAGGTGDISFRILEELLTPEDKQVLEKSFDPVDPSTIVQQGIKDAMDVYDSAAAAVNAESEFLHFSVLLSCSFVSGTRLVCLVL